MPAHTSGLEQRIYSTCSYIPDSNLMGQIKSNRAIVDGKVYKIPEFYYQFPGQASAVCRQRVVVNCNKCVLGVHALQRAKELSSSVELLDNELVSSHLVQLKTLR